LWGWREGDGVKNKGEATWEGDRGKLKKERGGIEQCRKVAGK